MRGHRPRCNAANAGHKPGHDAECTTNEGGKEMQERELTKAQAANAKTLTRKLSELPKEERASVARELNAYLEGYLTARRVFAA